MTQANSDMIFVDSATVKLVLTSWIHLFLPQTEPLYLVTNIDTKIINENHSQAFFVKGATNFFTLQFKRKSFYLNIS